MRICGGLAAGRVSLERICQLVGARQFWGEQESCRNLEESGGITGIPVPQEFLQKNPVKVAENRNS